MNERLWARIPPNAGLYSLVSHWSASLKRSLLEEQYSRKKYDGFIIQNILSTFSQLHHLFCICPLVNGLLHRSHCPSGTKSGKMTRFWFPKKRVISCNKRRVFQSKLRVWIRFANLLEDTFVYSSIYDFFLEQIVWSPQCPSQTAKTYGWQTLRLDFLPQ